ncbi:MAG: hypothetical protein MR933_06010 [Prevotella sp.]|uniref:hypothetical protein n=1 Tax=Prevotella sp. TaxID=59823 RepID=UPI0025D5A6B1|nr:hypothetical protein [Prevotella sp.]MCI7119332.1 hypothetical protein [Prevotella sp.]
MDTLSHFQSLEELIRALERERKLLQGLFNDRKRLSLRYDIARELAAKKDESLEFLRRFGVIRENGDFVELEDVYLKFFEEVLEVNEEINVASVKECIGELNAAIDYFQTENNHSRKYGYLKKVKSILRDISLKTLRNVIDLKRNIDNTYKNEPTFAIKKKKLVHLDEKRKDIAALITECEKVIDEKQSTFFLVAMDVQLKEIVTDVKLQLREVYHNLLELDRQIINYLNLIEYQNRLFEKVQKLKYLRDQMLLETNTDIRAKMIKRNPVWMEPRPRYTLKVSLSMLRTSDVGLKILQDIAKGKSNDRLRKGNLAEPFSKEELKEQQRILSMVDVREVKTAFLASGDNLFHFVMNYSGYRKLMTEEDKLVLFCQIAAQYLDELSISDELHCHNGIEYPLIYPQIA